MEYYFYAHYRYKVLDEYLEIKVNPFMELFNNFKKVVIKTVLKLNTIIHSVYKKHTILKYLIHKH